MRCDVTRFIPNWIPASVFCLFLLHCSAVESEVHKPNVTNGQATDAFPYVVKLSLDGRGLCTGTFVNTRQILTAAHCLDGFGSISWNGHTLDHSQFQIHDLWSGSESAGIAAHEARFDLALATFPQSVYSGSVPEGINDVTPDVGQAFTIVGFGNSLLTPYDRYCTVKPAKDDPEKCQLLVGLRKEAMNFDYSEIFAFPSDSGCNATRVEAEASRRGFKLDEMISRQCGGTISQQSYLAEGAGTKRMGLNVIRSVGEGVLKFQGSMGGQDSGSEAASGSGDSGGPMLLQRSNGKVIAGVTHGGYITQDQEGTLEKASIYVDLAEPTNVAWMQKHLLPSNSLLKARHDTLVAVP